MVLITLKSERAVVCSVLLDCHVFNEVLGVISTDFLLMIAPGLNGVAIWIMDKACKHPNRGGWAVGRGCRHLMISLLVDYQTSLYGLEGMWVKYLVGFFHGGNILLVWNWNWLDQIYFPFTNLLKSPSWGLSLDKQKKEKIMYVFSPVQRFVSQVQLQNSVKNLFLYLIPKFL